MQENTKNNEIKRNTMYLIAIDLFFRFNLICHVKNQSTKYDQKKCKFSPFSSIFSQVSYLANVIEPIGFFEPLVVHFLKPPVLFDFL